MEKIIVNLLLSLKSLLKKRYGDDLAEIYLFGSQANSYKPDSDFDIMLIFKKFKNWKEINQILDVVIDFGIKNDVVFDSKIYFEKDLNSPLIKEIPFIKNVLKTGIKI